MKKKKNKKYHKPKMPVEKPNGEHMPVCMSTGCERKVDDARKTICGYCQNKNKHTNVWDNIYNSMD